VSNDVPLRAAILTPSRFSPLLHGTRSEVDDVRTEFSMKFGTKIVVLEKMENGAAA
jgi:hypothetical protein